MTAERFECTLGGRNNSVLLACVDSHQQEIQVVAKLRHRVEGLHVLWHEWLAGALAERLGLRVPERLIVDVDAGFADVLTDSLQQDASACVGHNFGAAYVANTTPFVDRVGHLAEGLDVQAAHIASFDALSVNCDRLKHNPNCLITNSSPRELIAIDHDMALQSFYQLIFEVPGWPADILAQHVFRGRFGRRIPLVDFEARLAGLGDEFLDALPATVPPTWVDESTAGKMATIIRKIKERRKVARSWLSVVEGWTEQ